MFTPHSGAATVTWQFAKQRHLAEYNKCYISCCVSLFHSVHVVHWSIGLINWRSLGKIHSGIGYIIPPAKNIIQALSLHCLMVRSSWKMAVSSYMISIDIISLSFKNKTICNGSAHRHASSIKSFSRQHKTFDTLRWIYIIYLPPCTGCGYCKVWGGYIPTWLYWLWLL